MKIWNDKEMGVGYENVCASEREREKATEGRVNSRKNVFHTPLNSFICIHWLSENWNVLLQLNDWLNTDWWPDNIGIECHTLLAFGSTLIIIKKYVNGWREKNGNTNNNVSCKWVRVCVCRMKRKNYWLFLAINGISGMQKVFFSFNFYFIFISSSLFSSLSKFSLFHSHNAVCLKNIEHTYRWCVQAKVRKREEKR